MADNGDDKDAEYRISDGDYVVMKRGDIYKAAQIQKKRSVTEVFFIYFCPRCEMCHMKLVINTNW